MSTSVWGSSTSIKTLASNLNLNGAASILTGSDDPTSVAKSAPAGSKYLRSNGSVYTKTDSGSSTNWTLDVTGTASAAQNGVPLATKHFEVDLNSPAATQDGSISRPFKTIMGAVNQVITNGDNATYSYTIHVHPGTYVENLTFNSANLVSLTIFGDPDYGNSTIIQPTANTDAINSTSNNTNLQTLNLTNLYFIGNVHMVGDTNHSTFGANAVQFQNVILQGGNQQLTFNNIANLNLIECAIIPGSSGTLFKNIITMDLTGGFGILAGPLNVVTDLGSNIPSGFTLTLALFERTVLPLSTITVDAGSFIQTRGGVRVGTSGGSISLSGGYDAYTSFIRSNITVSSGGIYNNHGSVQSGTITNSGTVANNGHAGLLTAAIGASAVDATNAAIVWKDGHLKSNQTTAPTVTPNANAGTGATSPVANATDTAGQLTLVTGSGSWVAGEQTKVNFNKAYNVAPIVVLTPVNAAAANGAVSRGVYVTSATGTFSLNFATADTGATTYIWNYHVLETQ